ncbi:hypothetical protein MIZ03_4718 [Rhodoferax lithotrophicus]|uniref:Uncharacterized protein n=1 Tax=Rhodoferax lithotrophicus TaxID=2798804 RepID=A0ABM7MUC3_9BURK|nr:hypothetical protein MIZ03_4718 [Rhodoferax sp. MIZ03]
MPTQGQSRMAARQLCGMIDLSKTSSLRGDSGMATFISSISTDLGVQHACKVQP